MRLTRTIAVLCAVFSLLLLCSCGPSNSVRLMPLTPAMSLMPTQSAPTIAVVQFQDKRADTAAIGNRRDSSYFTTIDSPKDWLGKAIVDDLNGRGYRVFYAYSIADAVKASPDFMLTGSLEDLRVTEKSATSFETNIQVKYVLSNRDKKLMLETLSASQTRMTVPSASAVETLLTETLRDIVVPMGAKLSGAMPRP